MSVVRKLAQELAQQQLDSLEFLSISELDDEHELGLTDEQMDEVYDLVLRAEVVLPDG